MRAHQKMAELGNAMNAMCFAGGIYSTLACRFTFRPMKVTSLRPTKTRLLGQQSLPSIPAGSASRWACTHWAARDFSLCCCRRCDRRLFEKVVRRCSLHHAHTVLQMPHDGRKMETVCDGVVVPSAEVQLACQTVACFDRKRDAKLHAGRRAGVQGPFQFVESLTDSRRLPPSGSSRYNTCLYRHEVGQCVDGRDG